MSYESRTPLFSRAALILSVITVMLLIFGFGPKQPKQKDCPAPTLSMEQSNEQYVFTDPNVATRRAAQHALVERMCTKGYPGPGGKADCDLAKKSLANSYTKM